MTGAVSSGRSAERGNVVPCVSPAALWRGLNLKSATAPGKEPAARTGDCGQPRMQRDRT